VFALGVSPRGGLAGFIGRDLTLTPLSPLVGVTIVNLAVLKNDRARAIRFSTLTAICEALDCEIGELLVLAQD
jgi:putative transcriptional regulator